MSKPKILIVDDEPDVVVFMERALKAEGFDVVYAYDGISALDMVAVEKPDLVLVDIMMPMRSGYEVCEQIRANPQTQQIPLIVKPFVSAELIAQVRRYLRKDESAQAVE